jgi:hypothetical protein
MAMALEVSVFRYIRGYFYDLEAIFSLMLLFLSLSWSYSSDKSDHVSS